MYFDRTLQSAMTLKDPAALRLLYSRYTSIGLTFRPDAKKMLTHRAWRRVDSRKNSTKNFPIWKSTRWRSIRKWSRWPRTTSMSKKTKISAFTRRMGGYFLAERRTQYDIILLDAYFTDSMPFHLATKRIFRIGAAQTHAQRHHRRELDQRRNRTVRQNRALLRQNPAPGLSPDLYLRGAAARSCQPGHHSKRHRHRHPRQTTSRHQGNRQARRRSRQRSFSRPYPGHCRRLFRQALARRRSVLTDDYAPTDNLLNP